MSKAEIIIEIRELLSAIERDLNPYFWGDSMRYTGYLKENAADLNALILKLLEVK